MNTHCGFVHLIGAPNAGKSTLVNLLVGAKVSIVSPKEQTTRNKIRGIMQEENTQIILIDTPGVFTPKKRLEKAMVFCAMEDIASADICLFLIDAYKGISGQVENIIQTLKQNKIIPYIVLNKIDLINKEKLLPLIASLKEKLEFKEIFCISALKKENILELKNFLINKMPKSPYYFPENEVSDMPNRLFAAELTREKLFLYLQKELPYSIAVQTTLWQQNAQSIRIEQTILVERQGQKAIIIGKNGSMLKKIGIAVRLELEKLLGIKINLFLLVKVKENWAESRDLYTDWGLNFNAMQKN